MCRQSAGLGRCDLSRTGDAPGLYRLQFLVWASTDDLAFERKLYVIRKRQKIPSGLGWAKPSCPAVMASTLPACPR
ncbi:MAG: hypothetical protein R2932_13510 [Caldilineaceae bacterium]